MTDMQPANLEHTPGPELHVPTPPVGSEHIPVLPMPEAGVETGAERVEQVAEASAVAADAAGTPGAVGPPQVTVSQEQAAPATSMGPAVAADEDVIEKEWVDRAKKLVNDTKDDPYTRSEQVTALQTEYQAKRFGRDAKKAA